MAYLDRAQPIGAAMYDQLEDALSTADAFVFIVSPDASRSHWYQFELGVVAARSAREPGIKLIPVLADGTTAADVPWPLKAHSALHAHQANGFDEIASKVTDALAA